MFCKSCGIKLPENAKFCPECGTKITITETFMTDTLSKMDTKPLNTEKTVEEFDVIEPELVKIDINNIVPNRSFVAPETAYERAQQGYSDTETAYEASRRMLVKPETSEKKTRKNSGSSIWDANEDESEEYYDEEDDDRSSKFIRIAMAVATFLILIIIVLFIFVMINKDKPLSGDKQDSKQEELLAEAENTGVNDDVDPEENLSEDIDYSEEDTLASAETTEESEKPDTSDLSEAEPEANADYIISDSDKVLLTKADLSKYTKEELRIARNEIYARKGRKFKDAELQKYFDAKSWYKGTIEPDDFKESMLSDIELKNQKAIVEYEKEKGYR